MDYDKEKGIIKFRQGLESLDIELDNHQINQFIDYYKLLIEWNKVMNLTAITDFSDVVQKHFLDSLSIVNIFRPDKEKIIDIGTGAGLPGIPIKIAFPNTRMVLMDSLSKRIRFLDEVIQNLQLNNIQAIHGRAEDYGRKASFRESFDICTSRAVAKLSVLSEYCIPFIKIGGGFISYKSGNIKEELADAKNAIELLGGSTTKTLEFDLPNTDIGRSLIYIKKTKSTAREYPRTAGKPSKEPL